MKQKTSYQKAPTAFFSIRPLIKIAFHFFISAKTPPLIHYSLPISYLRYLITLFYTALFFNTKYNIIYEFT